MLLLCLYAANHAFAQTSSKDSISSQNEIFVVVVQQPSFSLDKNALSKYIQDNLVYPPKALKKKITGNVYVKFVVHKNGKLTDIKVVKGIGYGCDEEAVKLVQGMPDWIPGKQGGVIVDVYYVLVVPFSK